jgi:hypothetical protein
MMDSTWRGRQPATADHDRRTARPSPVPGAPRRAARAAQPADNPRNFPSSLLPRPTPACMRRLPRTARRYRPPLLGFGGSIVVQGSGHEITIAGPPLALGRSESLDLRAEPWRLATGSAPRDRSPVPTRQSGARRAAASIRCIRRDGSPKRASIGPCGVNLFSRFFPSIPRYELYKMGPGASARVNSGDVASRSSQLHCGYLLSFETDA